MVRGVGTKPPVRSGGCGKGVVTSGGGVLANVTCIGWIPVFFLRDTKPSVLCCFFFLTYPYRDIKTESIVTSCHY